MAIVTRSICSVKIFNLVAETRPEVKEYLDNLEASLDDRTFSLFPGPANKGFLLECVASRKLPSTRSVHDTVTRTDETITVQREWLDLAAAHEFVDILLNSNTPHILSAEVVEI